MEHAQPIERAFTTRAEAFERVRDPSHTRMLDAVEFQALLTEAGELWFIQTFGSAIATRSS